jgi:hypothetical protein
MGLRPTKKLICKYAAKYNAPPPQRYFQYQLTQTFRLPNCTLYDDMITVCVVVVVATTTLNKFGHTPLPYRHTVCSLAKRKKNKK